MTHPLLRLALFVPLCLGVAACSNSPPPPRTSGDTKKSPTVAEIGSPLFGEAAWPKYDADAAPTGEPIRVPLCHLTVLDKVDVSSKEEGAIEWLGIETGKSGGVADRDLHINNRTDTAYRRLRLGDRVV